VSAELRCAGEAKPLIDDALRNDGAGRQNLKATVSINKADSALIGCDEFTR
jgi:hypothetical protein